MTCPQSMYQWLFLISLSVVGIGTTTLSIISFYVPMNVGGHLDESKWAGVHFYEGRIRFFLLEHTAGAPIQVVHRSVDSRTDLPRPMLWIHFGETEEPLTLAMLQSGDVPRTGNWRITIGGQRAVTPFVLRMPSLGREQRANQLLLVNLLRMPIWVLSVSMVIPPALGALRGPITQRRRRRRNLCTVCGYDPIGNPSDICPECGLSLSAPPAFPPSIS